MKRRLIVIFLTFIAVLQFAVLVKPVLAHANLLVAVPEANATLDRPPAQIELFFSEPIADSFSTIEVLDISGKQVDGEDAQVDPADPTRMTVSLRSMPDGVYTVNWRALSSVDSHVTAGAYPFAVGNVEAAALEAAAQASVEVRLSPAEVAVRWLTYLSAMVLVGGQIFMLIVWRPAVVTTGIGSQLTIPWRPLARIALLVLLVANLAWLLVQAGQASGAEIAWPWNPAVGQVLFTTRFGALWLVRFALALVLIWLSSKDQTSLVRWISFGVGALLLLTISLGSHGAAQPQPILPIVADWVHLVTVSVWVGGLTHFLLGLRASRSLEVDERTRFTAVLIPRFSGVAVISVGLMALTGLYASFLHVGTLNALTSTAYGQTLMFKLALVLLMLLFGATNLVITSSRMKAAADSGGDGSLIRRFRRLLSSEVVLGVTVFLTVAILTTLPPANVPDVAPMLGGEQAVDDLKVALEVTPGRAGLNTFVVTVAQDGRPLDDAREVALQFTPTSVELPPIQAQMTAQGDGQYSTEGGFLSLPDVWQVQVAVRRADAFDAFANFDLEVGTTAGASTNVQFFPWNRVAGITLLVAGMAFLLALEPLILSRTQSVVFGWAPAILLATVGFLVIFDSPGEQTVIAVNPIPPNADSIAEGEALYIENCLPCHGPTGAGDGPVGITLNPPPADLTIHTAPGVHPDGRLYDWITNGFPTSVMPAFQNQLTDEERWHLVNYIRTLNQP
jgi:copper transport protein